MREANSPRFSPELLRSIIGTIIWVGIGLLALNAASSRRILECDRTSGQVQCQLSTQQLLEKKRVPQFATAKLQKAIVGKHQGRRMIKGYLTVYEIDLVTDQSNFSLTTNEMEHIEKYRLADSINAFLENPQIPTLRVEEGYNSTIMGIVIGIFLSMLALLIFAIFMTLRFLNPSPNETTGEVLKQLWGANLENCDREGEHRRLIAGEEQTPTLGTKIDHRPDT